jgi:hypothetical protein
MPSCATSASTTSAHYRAAMSDATPEVLRWYLPILLRDRNDPATRQKIRTTIHVVRHRERVRRNTRERSKRGLL